MLLGVTVIVAVGAGAVAAGGGGGGGGGTFVWQPAAKVSEAMATSDASERWDGVLTLLSLFFC
jgi:hypothetical protein